MTKTLAAMLDNRSKKLISILLSTAIQHGGDDVSWKRSIGQGHQVEMFRLVKLPQNCEHVLSVWNSKN